MDLDEIRALAAEVLVPPFEPARLIDTVVAAGVVAADATLRAGSLGQVPAPGLPLVGAYSEPVAARLSWSDPAQWLREHRDDAGFAADWWGLVRPPEVTQPIRLSVVGLAPGDDVPSLLRLLAQGRYVGSAVAKFEATGRGGRRRRWSWPLRLAVAPGIGVRGSPVATARLRELAPWWELLTRSVDFSGRWARASLGVVTRSAEAGPADLHAAAVVVLVGPGEPVDAAALARCAEVYRADAVGAVQVDGEPARFLAELVAALAHDQPLDVAMFTAARAAAHPDPIVLADPAFLDATRMLHVLSETLPAYRPEQLPSDPIERVSRGGVVSEVRVAGGLVRGSDGAVHVAALLTNERVEARRRPREVLRAEVIDRVSGEAVQRLQPGRAYALRVTFVRSADDPDAAPPRLLVTDVAARVSLAAELTDAPPPSDGAPFAATFPFVAGAAGSRIEWRVIVTQGLRFLRTAMLHGVVGAAEGVRLQPEAVARAGTDDLDLAHRHDLALVLNHDDTGARLLTTIADDAVDIHKVTGPGEIEELAILLQRQVEAPDRFGDYTSEAYRDLLVRLAMAGWSLYKGLFGRMGVVPESWQERLLAARRISILSARPGDVLPLELVYAKPLRLVDAAAGRLCEHADRYVDADTGGCEARCPNAAAEQVVCPYAFWGANKIVERHVNRAASTSLSRDYALAIGPDIDRHALSLDIVVAAASDRADCNDVQAWTVATKAIAPPPLIAQTWRDLRSVVARLREQGTPPQVLMLVPHVARNSDRQPVLEIGSGDVLDRHLDLAPIVDDREPVNPLVLLMGCGTATAKAPLFDEPARFLGSGAPGVIGTLTAVRGRHIVPVAAELLRALREQAAAGGPHPPLGEALLRTRRRGLAAGDATVLALLPFGDTDWELRL